MKTKEGWDNSNQSLSSYLRVGDEVGECIVEYFYSVLPPITMNRTMVQKGEPFTHDNKGLPLFATVENQDGKWTFTGYKRSPNF